ncbi:glycosyltransferase family protein [Aquirufa sp. TARAVU-A1A]
MGRFIFTVQGEGRGHLTQAISLTQIAREAGHEVVGYAVGSFEGRKIPSFFRDFIGETPFIQYESPSINYGKGKSVQLGKTAMQAFTKFGTYWKSASQLGEFIEDLQPDGIVNFYESITGLYNLKSGAKIPCMSVGHQYLLLSEHFESIPEKALDRYLLNLNTRITAIGSRKLLGLSFRELPNDSKRNIIAVPPLLRHEVKSIQAQAGERWLAYLTHYRLADEIMAWSKQNPEVKLDCFWDNPTIKTEYAYSDSLTFHPIDAEKYLDKMTHCAGLISTAGFESVAEAMYLGKPVMMVPVPNHIEQMINAHDGVLSGAGVRARSFDLNIFKDYLPRHKPVQDTYQHWVSQANFGYQLTDLIRKPVASPTFSPRNEGGLSTSW